MILTLIDTISYPKIKYDYEHTGLFTICEKTTLFENFKTSIVKLA